MTSTKYRIGIDMDDVICNTHARLIRWAEQEFGLALHDRANEPIETLLTPSQNTAMTEMLNEGSIFRHLAPMDGAVEILAELYRAHDIFIVTAAMEHPGSLQHKFTWVEEHLPFFDPLRLVFCGHKHVVNVDYLIDDTPHHFEKLDGRGILYDAPKNRRENRYDRVRNWQDISRFFAAALA